MPCCYIIDEDKELVILVAEGVSNDDEMIAVTRKLAGEPKYCREFRFFCELGGGFGADLSDARGKTTQTRR